MPALEKGPGAVLSWHQESGPMHPIAFASRALSAAERNYSITEIETLAMVWSISTFVPITCMGMKLPC